MSSYGIAGYDAGMETYMSQGEVAKFIGVLETSMPKISPPLPAPDAVIGASLRRPSNGWTRETILDWYGAIPAWRRPGGRVYGAAKCDAQLLVEERERLRHEARNSRLSPSDR